MDFAKVEDFFRNHWPAALIATLIVAPSVWTIAATHFSERIATLEAREKELKERNAVLDEFARRSRVKFETVTERLTAEDLYTPSQPVALKMESK